MSKHSAGPRRNSKPTICKREHEINQKRRSQPVGHAYKKLVPLPNQTPSFSHPIPSCIVSPSRRVTQRETRRTTSISPRSSRGTRSPHHKSHFCRVWRRCRYSLTKKAEMSKFVHLAVETPASTILIDRKKMKMKVFIS